MLHRCLPRRIDPYLFEDGEVRRSRFDFGALRNLVRRHADDLAARVERVFRQGWPEEDAGVTTPDALRAHVEAFTDSLEDVVVRLRRRLEWAMRQISRLNALRERRGTLEPDDEALFRRCDRLVKRLKGTDRRSRRQAGVCIYLDGLSADLHGDPRRAEHDREIRTWLRNRGYEVVEIAANELDDEDAMARHFRRLAGYLSMPDVRPNRARAQQSRFRTDRVDGRRGRLRDRGRRTDRGHRIGESGLKRMRAGSRIPSCRARRHAD